VGWDGMGWGGLGWDGMGWDGMGWGEAVWFTLAASSTPHDCSWILRISGSTLKGVRVPAGWDGVEWSEMGWDGMQ
jgi:hypothetical protein